MPQLRIIGYRGGEKGLALILAIGFLAILSILGAVVLDVSTRDLAESGTFRPAREAFYAADRAVEYSMNTDIIFDLSTEESINLVTNQKLDKNGNVSGTTAVAHSSVINGAGPGTLVSGLVKDLGPNALPPSVAALYGSDTGANFYHVEVEAEQGDMHSRVDASIVRLFDGSSDSILHTSGGG